MSEHKSKAFLTAIEKIIEYLASKSDTHQKLYKILSTLKYDLHHADTIEWVTIYEQNE